MINFAVGPVQMAEEIRAVGAEEIPYFRTPEFSALMRENEDWMKECMGAGADARALFLTGSGTAAMEAAVINLFDAGRDRLLIVNGGSFGARFAKICGIHHIPYEEIRLEPGRALSDGDLALWDGRCREAGLTGFLINACETSTGVAYDMEMVGAFCRRNGLVLAVDAVSSFLADEMRMEEWDVALALTGSQKALALPPGLSILVLRKAAICRVEENRVESLYFDLKEYLKDGERGQTPFTPAVGVLLQLHERLAGIRRRGIPAERARIRAQAEDFREKLGDLPFRIASESLSSALTPLTPVGTDREGKPVPARRIFEILKDEYGIYICPNGGELADRLFRVGHIGNLTPADNDCLIAAWRDMQKRGLL